MRQRGKEISPSSLVKEVLKQDSKPGLAPESVTYCLDYIPFFSATHVYNLKLKCIHELRVDAQNYV